MLQATLEGTQDLHHPCAQIPAQPLASSVTSGAFLSV